jgi:FAD synthetase
MSDTPEQFPNLRQSQTAAILIIGNEILSGKVADQNAAYLCRELRALGVNVQRVVVVPDAPEVIAGEVRFCRKFDLVFTTGGVGPTHDDVTMEGVAKGLERKLVHHPALEKLLARIYPSHLSRVHLKLAEVPDGTELIHAEGLWLPVIRVENIYIFPGVPDLLQNKFDAIKERFKESPFFLKKIFIKGHEEEIASHLNSTLVAFPHLLLGSYPEWGNPDHDVYLTLESKDPCYLDRAMQFLLGLLPNVSIVKTE